MRSVSKSKRKRGRRARRASRSKAMRRRAATFALSASLVVPRMVHTELRSVSHPTWDRLLDRIGQGMRLGAGGRLQLRCWVHDLVMSPKTPQPALLLTGPECSGKHTFHKAMGLLLPDHSIIYYSQHCSGNWNEMLRRAWLMVIEGHPERFIGLFGHQHRCEDRYLKWCLTHTQSVDPMPNVRHFEVGLLATTIPRSDLVRRLEDERDAFQRTLTRCKVAA